MAEDLSDEGLLDSDDELDQTSPGPDDQTTPGPGDQTTPGPGDQNTPGPGDQTTPVPGDLELDYDELMDNEEETAAAEDIEEGELSSDEEGEIKESDDEVRTSPSKPSSANGGKLSREKPPARGVSGREASPRDATESSEEHPGHRAHKKSLDKTPVLCRHFVGGKCSWGESCRFLHERPERVRPPDRDWWEPRAFPPLPPYLPGPGLMGPPLEPRLPFPPPGLAPFPPHERRPLHPRALERTKPQFGESRTEIREETEGWLRLRTITHEWSSDEEQEKLPSQDLRHKIMRKKDSDSERPGRAADEWTDPWARDTKKPNKKRKKLQASSTEDSSNSDSDDKRKRRKGKAKNSSSGDSSDSEAKRKAKKRKKKAKDSSDDEDIQSKRKYHGVGSAIHHPFDPRRFNPRDEFYPPHFPPPMIPEHRHPWPPHLEPPPLPKKDEFGRDISKRIEYEDLKKHRLEEERRSGVRRRSSDFSGSPTPPAKPDSSSEEERARPKKSKKSKNTDKKISRKEKLLQELEAINKVIEKKKKAKKHSY